MRVVGLNVQHGGGTRVAAIVAAVAALEPDVVVLSEFHVSGRGDELLGALKGIGLVHHRTGSPTVAGHHDTVSIASRLPMSLAYQPLVGSPDCHRVVESTIEGVLVVGVYFPLGAPKVRFWRDEFLPYAHERIGEPALLIGDWNSGSHYLDEAGATLNGASEFEAMSRMGWSDAWREANPDGREYTWYSRPWNNGFRLDHAFLSPSIVPRLRSVRYAHETRRQGITDHSALVVDLL